MKLQLGMRVRIKDSVKDYKSDSGKIKTITSDLPDFRGMRSFGLDSDLGIWQIEDFVECVDYPQQTME